MNGNQYAPVRSPAAVRSDIVWEIDRSSSHGELSTEQWLLGRNVVELEVIDGLLVRRGNEWMGLSLAMRADARDGGTVIIEFDGDEFKRDDHGRYTVPGELRIDGAGCAMALGLHDLGTTDGPHAPRRYATVAGRVAMPSAGGRIWNRVTAGPQLNVFAHTEWLTR